MGDWFTELIKLGTQVAQSVAAVSAIGTSLDQLVGGAPSQTQTTTRSIAPPSAFESAQLGLAGAFAGSGAPGATDLGQHRQQAAARR